MRLVYFSNISENTHRFVQRLQEPALRIPVRGQEQLLVDEPYVLIVPTYGDGVSTKLVPRQVVKFLNIEQNRQLIRGVIGAGNTNFGEHFAAAGEIVAAKCQVPYLYRFELMGTQDDIERVQNGLIEFWNKEEKAPVA